MIKKYFCDIIGGIEKYRPSAFRGKSKKTRGLFLNG